MTGRLRVISLALAGLLLAPELPAQGIRHGVAAGMGVNYLRMKDVVDLANASRSIPDRVAEFNAGVEFFIRATWPLGDDWALGFDYAYQLTGLTTTTQFGAAEFTVTQHAPTILIERVLIVEKYYSLIAGLGVGYSGGTVEEKSPYLGGKYSASGAALLALLEGNTALSEDLFVCLGLTARWGWAGRLEDDAGRSPGAPGAAPTLHQFGVGARLGVTYSF